MPRLDSSFVRFGAVAISLTASACSPELFGGPRQDTVPTVVRATPKEVAADPCKYSDLTGCTQRCVERRDPASCNTVAVMLEWGNTDQTSAAPYYSRACAGAYAPGCTGLAWLHLLGQGVDKDVPLAMSLFTRAYDGYRLACARGELKNCVAAAEMLIEGRGVENDEALAMTMLEDACAKGEAKACDRAKSLR